MKSKIKFFLLKYMCVFAGAVIMLVQNSDSCLFINYQPELPEELKNEEL